MIHKTKVAQISHLLCSRRNIVILVGKGRVNHQCSNTNRHGYTQHNLKGKKCTRQVRLGRPVWIEFEIRNLLDTISNRGCLLLFHERFWLGNEWNDASGGLVKVTLSFAVILHFVIGRNGNAFAKVHADNDSQAPPNADAKVNWILIAVL